jgi:16S rRNA (uracil1498-N3)-methyltransferase
MNVFYCESIQEETAFFDASESRHALRSLRLQLGDLLFFTDGMGNLYQGTIAHADPNKMQVSAIDLLKHAPLPSVRLGLAFALTKSSERFEMMVEKCVEIGIQDFYPFYSFHSERNKLNADRLNKIVLSAMKQSGRLFLPVVHPLQKFKTVLDQCQKEAQLFIAYCGQQDLPLLQPSLLTGQGKKIVFIGPEGDFSAEEYHWACGAGAKGVSLGPYRLRTETAGIIAMHSLSFSFYS